MNTNRQKNYAFIDSQNLNLSIQELGWNLDFGRFYVYLKDKYKIVKVFLLSDMLQEMNPYILFYKNLVILLFLNQH